MEDQNTEDWDSLFKKEFENDHRQNQYRERGKLGGRPKLNTPKSERLRLRFTPSEMKMLKERADKKTEAHGLQPNYSFRKSNSGL